MIGSVAKGWNSAETERKKLDLEKTISDTEETVSSLEDLVSQYETLAGKVNKTDEEYTQMQTLMTQIAELAPGYASALTQAQGDITESIRIANQALDEQIKKLNDLRVSQASNSLSSEENLTNWDKAFSAYAKITKAYEQIMTYGGDLSSFESYDDWMEQLSSKEFNTLLAGSDSDSPWGQLMSHFGFKNDDDLFNLFKNRSGEFASEFNVLESAAQTALSQIISLISDTL